MLTWMRSKMRGIGVSILVGIIAFVFIFYGVFGPKSLRGLHPGALAGLVNGEQITITEYSQQYKYLIEMFKDYGDGKVSDEMIKGMGLKKLAFDGLVRKKVLAQKAFKEGLMPSTQAVADVIANYSVFQKNKVFDYVTYQNLLSANKMSPHRFEKTITEELASQTWEKLFDEIVKVSDLEAKKDFLVKNTTARVRYVVIPPMELIAVKDLKTPSEKVIADFVKNKQNEEKLKKRYELEKEALFKEQDYEQGKSTVASLLIMEDQKTIARNAVLDAVERYLLKTDKVSDEKLKKVLDQASLTLNDKSGVNFKTDSLKNLSSIDSILLDLFSKKSLESLKEHKGLEPIKTYEISNMTVRLAVVERGSANFAEFDKTKKTLLSSLLEQKSHKIYQAWVDKMLKQANIESNPDVLADN